MTSVVLPPPRANTRSGTHSTWRMPMAIVPPCALARSPSSRSPTILLAPVSNTSFGILLLIVNDVPDRVRPPRPRAVLNSSTPCASGIMMNPRSALVTSSAESITSVSTSSSTRPDPSARRPLRMAAICARSLASVDVERSTDEASSSARNTISTLSLCPSRMVSPWSRGRSAICSPLTNVP